MADLTAELNELFAAPNAQLQLDVLGELKSILRIHALSPQDLFFKWESYSIKMGAENTRMDYKTARDFKKDLQDVLEREARGKAHNQASNKKSIAATPRNANTGDVFGVLDSIMAGSGTPASRNSAMKRRNNNYDTPSSKVSKVHGTASPHGLSKLDVADNANAVVTPFAERQNAGQVLEQLNGHLTMPGAPSEARSEARVKLKANTELVKFAYKPMAMKLSEASEILDDRIDEFAQVVQDHHKLDGAAFGNPAARGTAEIIAVGRIASDASEGKLNAASLVLETSRRMGAGMRVPLRMEKQAFDVFPGKIVALKGINPSGEYFTVSEVLSIPRLPLPATAPEDIELHNARVTTSEPDTGATPLNIIVASGPYTPDTDLSYAALHALCEQAVATAADVLILSGPFLDLEHPLISAGDFSSLPSTVSVSSDTATLTDLFRALISAPLSRLVAQLPTITVILVPSVRDAISKHVSWPQDRFPKKELGLPRQVTCVTNPITLSINELVVGISSEDILFEIQRQRVASSFSGDALASLAANVIEQRHFFPLFPPLPPKDYQGPGAGVSVGASLDIAYLKLGEMLNIVPDLLILPSVLTPFARVVEGVMVVNPGTASKKRAPGTFARLGIGKREVSREEEESGEMVDHWLHQRARVDVVRI